MNFNEISLGFAGGLHSWLAGWHYFLRKKTNCKKPMPSTVISSFFYNADARILKIVFVSGMVYNYKNVPKGIYEALQQSTSKGIYFNRNIRGKYEFEKVED